MKLPLPIQTLLEKLSPRGLVPPQDIMAEEAALGAAMIDKSSAASIIEIIGQRTEDDSPFYRDAHTLIYLAMLKLDQRGEPIDLVTAKNQLALDGKLEEIGGPAYLAGLTSKVVTTVNVPSYARSIILTWLKREGIALMEEYKLRLFEGEQDALECLTEAESLLSQIIQSRSTKSGRFQRIADVSMESVRLMEQAGKKEGEALSFGLKELDELTDGGSRAGELIILAARSSHGKTSLADTFARAASMGEHAKASTAIFSLEMTGPQLVMRMLCAEAGVPLSKARSGKMDDVDWQSIMEAHKRLAASGIHLYDLRGTTLSNIRSSARHLATKLSKTERPLKRIILDYIALPKLPGEKRKSEEIGELAMGLKILAGELGTDMVALSQITRDVVKRKPPRPMLSDLAESGELEEHADITLLLYRPEVHKIFADESYMTRLGSPATSGIAEIIVAKQRNGTTGEILARFVKEQARFENIPVLFPDEPPPQAEILF